jgi:hypothetical protein
VLHETDVEPGVPGQGRYTAVTIRTDDKISVINPYSKALSVSYDRASPQQLAQACQIYSQAQGGGGQETGGHTMLGVTLKNGTKCYVRS